MLLFINLFKEYSIHELSVYIHLTYLHRISFCAFDFNKFVYIVLSPGKKKEKKFPFQYSLTVFSFDHVSTFGGLYQMVSSPPFPLFFILF